MKSIRSLGDQIAIAISAKFAHMSPPLNETDNFPINIWCRNCNQYGHSEQFCQMPKFQGPYAAPQFRPNFTNQSGGQPQPRRVSCPTYHCMHPIDPKICWIQTGVTCGSSGGNYPTDRCRKAPKEPEPRASFVPNPSHNLFYNRPLQRPQQTYNTNPQLAQWYSQPYAMHPMGQPPVHMQPPKSHQVVGPNSSNINSHYYVEPLSDHSPIPRLIVYLLPIVL